MTTIQLNVPKPIAKLHPKIREKAMLQSLRDSLNRLISEEREELKDVKLKMRRFERKYKTSFNAFEKKIPAAGNYKIHEDYGEWPYLHERSQAIMQNIKDYEHAYGAL
ncbi:hypothetical protein HUU40_23875 [candidate division KSB1 bacterium]|nr:hypothetical protein [candidate division KSB1 bacterium]